MVDDPLLTTLLDLDAALGSQSPLIIGGGYGLFLKQLHLVNTPQIQTLFAPDDWPPARTTNDIDLILRAEIVTDSNAMKAIRAALDLLGCDVVGAAKYTQFLRRTPTGPVKIDLLAAPLGEFAASAVSARSSICCLAQEHRHRTHTEKADLGLRVIKSLGGHSIVICRHVVGVPHPGLARLILNRLLANQFRIVGCGQIPTATPHLAEPPKKHANL